MEQHYNIIRLRDGKKLKIPSFNFNDSGWQTFEFNNCIPYFDSGSGFDTHTSFIYEGEDLDQGEWVADDIFYYMGATGAGVKDSLSDTHGGLLFIYFDPSNGKYYLKSITKIDSKKYIYVNGYNYLGQEFINANDDYPTSKIFYNITGNDDNFYSATIKTNNAPSLGYILEMTESDLHNFYPVSLDYSEDLNLEYTNYPDEIDPLRFFQDIDLYDKDKWGIYLGYLTSNKLVDAANYLDQSGLDYYGPPILNLIEQRLYAMEYFAPIIIGDKPKLALYQDEDTPIQGVHYVDDI